MEVGGRQLPMANPTIADCTKLEDQLKNSIRAYFVGQTAASVFHIERISRKLGKTVSVSTINVPETDVFLYKPSSVAQTTDLSALEIAKELQQAKSSLAIEKRRKEELEATLSRIKYQEAEGVDRLKAVLSQAEARYQELLLQQQHTEEQLLDFQESYRLIERKLADAQKQISTLESQLNSIEDQRSALQVEVDVSAARIRALEQALADLERQYGEEKNIRKHVEISLVNLEEALTLAEQAHSLETESNWGQIMELKDQLKSSEIQRGSLQTALNEANARVESLSRECSDLAQRYQNEARCRNEAEATVLMQRESYAQSEQILREQNENQAEVMASLRKQIDDAEAQKKLCRQHWMNPLFVSKLSLRNALDWLNSAMLKL